eukprot:14635262-Alexandrium_andersonii.AAC.1
MEIPKLSLPPRPTESERREAAEVVRAVTGRPIAGTGEHPPGSVVPPEPVPTKTRAEIAELQAELAASKASASAA